ncbi:hypothetical protein GCM10023171_32540 [Microbacterium panaciterrae]|uniref:Uncharacterized protein n=1 Tax=Microbacterium panaciterrae TaxID=985759 RepID=A0ABP8PRY4_9MICO
MQDTLWITLWRVCGKRGSVCAERLGITMVMVPPSNFVFAWDQGFSGSTGCGWESLKPPIEGWRPKYVDVYNRDTDPMKTRDCQVGIASGAPPGISAGQTTGRRIVTEVQSRVAVS